MVSGELRKDDFDTGIILPVVELFERQSDRMDVVRRSPLSPDFVDKVRLTYLLPNNVLPSRPVVSVHDVCLADLERSPSRV